jgi:hypothetical protein
LPVLALCAALCGGCSEVTSVVRLPEIGKLPDRVLSKDEQQNKVQQMIAKGQNHRNEAVKEIEEDR